ncbi:MULTISPECIES: glutathione S-transferase family protein [Halomonadaceae]|uniref:Glutathione S-transferase family protein n=1 Tax=Vreelandella halophila TaxID=86177 RepID=A0A9X4YE02_9GAMM|nr:MULTISPECIES: glutathione S-transferase family protein [Halomonas]MYL27736.1 glutathione S-transferase family protein [Halomonas utahensis]MYL75466.1 glutathione S-transferase family protein [Halomonas sp. 22501_18_FS]
MGLLINGQWHDQWYDTAKSGGAFVRESAQFRNWVTPDGSAGPTGDAGFAAEPGRYHLYVALACPWAHRTLVFRRLKGLEEMIPVSIVHPDMLENGWAFRPDDPFHRDHENGARFMHEIYTRDTPDYTGRVTIPCLWDTHRKRIVSNESADLIRMFNSAFDGQGARALDFHPEPLRDEIDAVNERVYNSVNNGVYRAGFATAQDKYEQAFTEVFDALDWLDGLLAEQRYLVGNRLTEADWRLFTTLVRFDAVYYSHFKCNRQQLRDFPNLQGYLKDLYQIPGVADTVNIDQIKRHYYRSQRTINPTQIVPAGPRLELERPHGRGHLGPDFPEACASASV